MKSQLPNIPRSCVTSKTIEFASWTLYRGCSDRHVNDQINKLLYWVNGFHKEILFYYCEKIVHITGTFDFVDISQGQASAHEWKALTVARERLNRRHKDGIVNRQEYIKDKHRAKGLPPSPEAELNPVWYLPEVRFVALVMDGFRYWDGKDF